MKQMGATAVMLLALLTVIFSTVTADAAMKKTLTPRMSIQEQYNDNIDLEPDNEESDWITLASPGISLSLEGPDTRLNLDYEVGFSQYLDNSSRDSTRHQGQTTWEQDLSEHLRFRLSDIFVRSENPILETDGQIEEIRREREIYYRNTGEAILSYEFGSEDEVTAGYWNRYEDDTSFRDQDSLGHEGFVNLDAWFTPRYGIGLTSSYLRGEFEQENDFDQHRAGLTLNYRWEPSRRLYTSYSFLDNDFDDLEMDAFESDYLVHRVSLGVSLALAPNTQLNIEGGYFLQDYAHGGQRDGITFDGSLSTQIQRTSLYLEASGGYDEDYFSPENLGSTEYREVIGSASHLLTENLRVFASASYRSDEFSGAIPDRDREDEVWGTRAGLSFSFWRWLTLALEGTHTERKSDDPTVEFRENRVMLRLTVAYPYVF
jgi:hypothetical protein